MTQPETAASPVLSTVVNVVAIILGVAALALVTFLVVRAARRLWTERRLRRREGVSTGVEVVQNSQADYAVDAPIVQQGVRGAIVAIDETPEPGDAIIAAWVGLEQTAHGSGLTRGDSETPAEFVLRLIGRTEEIAEPTAILLDIYEQVRFGGRNATEHERAIARGALYRIEEGWR